MILPIHPHHGPLHHLLVARQAIPPGDDTGTDTATDATDTPKTTRTTTITDSTSTGTSGSTSTSSSSALDRVKATTHLEWWQLLCVALGGSLILFLGVWIVWRTRRRRAAEQKQAKEIQDAEDKKIQELLAQRQKDLDEEDREEEESSDEWDYSDGGTAVPRKRGSRSRGRKGSGGGRGGRSRGRDYSESESDGETESDWSGSSSESGLSDRTYYERYRRPRRTHRSRDRSSRRGRDRDRDRRSDRDRGRGRSDRRGERYRERDRSHRRQPSYTPSPSPTPLPPVPPLPRPTPQRKKRETNFRDSVFSSYTSMKQAAVKLKHVEAKVKLKKALESEERLEQARRDKIREANREIEMANRRTESGGSDRPLIPPVHRQTTSSSGGSTATTPHLPTPPPRSAVRRGYSAESTRPTHAPARGDTRTYSENPIPPVQSRAPHPVQKQSGLNGEIQNLLGGKTSSQGSSGSKAGSRPTVSNRPPESDNAFQNSWLSRPDPGVSVPQSATNSVYLPVTRPKDRPMIPPGGLAPAPPPKARVKQSMEMGTLANPGETRGTSGVGGVRGVPAAGAKWADRLRSRK